MDPSQLIDELVGAGMFEHQIGTAIGRSQATVNRVRRGKHGLSSWEAVEKLRALHREKLPGKYPSRRSGEVGTETAA